MESPSATQKREQAALVAAAAAQFWCALFFFNEQINRSKLRAESALCLLLLLFKLVFPAGARAMTELRWRRKHEAPQRVPGWSSFSWFPFCKQGGVYYREELLRGTIFVIMTLKSACWCARACLFLFFFFFPLLLVGLFNFQSAQQGSIFDSFIACRFQSSPPSLPIALERFGCTFSPLIR